MDQQNLEETKEDGKMINEAEQQNQIVPANDLPKVYLWGSAENDQMDLGEDKFDTRTGFEMSYFLQNRLEVVSVICGGLHTLALTKQGQIYSWGCSDDGILGRESTMESCKSPGLVPLDCPVDMIGTGDTHSIAANSKHSVVFFWGVYRNSSGQMGEVAKVPQRVGETDFKDKIISKILCGYNHTLFFVKKSLDDKHGEILTQGEPDSSVIGRKPTARHKVEQSLKIIGLGISHVVDVYTGAKHAFLKQIKNQTKAKGGNEFTEKILGWGLNNYGQLGLGHTQDQVLRPEEIEFFNDKEIVNIVGGDEHTLALTSDGKVYGFGRNDDGTLGLGEDFEQPAEEQHQEQKVTKKKPLTKKQQKLQQQNQMVDENQDVPHAKKFKFVTYPTLIPSLKGVIDIHCGMSSSYAITKNASNEVQLYSWGDSEHYLLCNGKDDEPEFEPYQIRPTFLKNQKLLVTKSFTGQETYQFKIGGQHGAFIVVSDQYKENFGSFDEKCLTEIDEKYLPHQSKKTPFRSSAKAQKSAKQSAQSNVSKATNNKESQMMIEDENSDENQEQSEDKAQEQSKPKAGASKSSKKGPKGKKQQKQEQIEKIDEEVEEKSPKKDEEEKQEKDIKEQKKEQEQLQQSEKKESKKADESQEKESKQQQESSAVKSSRGRPKSASKIKQSQQKEMTPVPKSVLKSPEKEKVSDSPKRISKSPEKKSVEKSPEKEKSPSKIKSQSMQKSSKKQQQQSQVETSQSRQTRSKTPTAASVQVQTRSHQKSPQPSPTKQSATKQQQQQESVSKQSAAKESSKTPLKSETKSRAKQQQTSASKQKEKESSKKLKEQEEKNEEEQQKDQEEKIEDNSQEDIQEKQNEIEDLKKSKDQIVDKQQVSNEQQEQKQDQVDAQQIEVQSEKNNLEEKKETSQQTQSISSIQQQQSEKIQIEEEEQQQQLNKSLQSQQKQMQQSSQSQSKQLVQQSVGKASSTKKRDYENLIKDDDANDESKLSMEELKDPLKKIKEQ